MGCADVLDIAYCGGCEAELARHIEGALDAGELLDPTVLRRLCEAQSPRGEAGLPAVTITMPTAPAYDVLLPATTGSQS